LIAALGARPVRPDIKGIDGSGVFSAEEVLLSSGESGKKNRHPGRRPRRHGARYLSGRQRPRCHGHRATAGTQRRRQLLQGIAIGIELRRLGICVLLNAKALEITDKGVTVQNPDGQELLEADTVIYAVGQKPLRDEAGTLRFCARNSIRSAIASLRETSPRPPKPPIKSPETSGDLIKSI
jgi:hypothetical protein